VKLKDIRKWTILFLSYAAVIILAYIAVILQVKKKFPLSRNTSEQVTAEEGFCGSSGSCILMS
jgi:hypothetical protein